LPPKTGDRHVRVVLRITDNSKDASARVQLSSATEPYVEKCMTRNLCLKKLSEGASGFAIRNNNTKQLQCLQGEDVSETCLGWKKCLLEIEDHVDELIKILRAGLLPASSQGEMIQILSTRRQGLERTQNQCIDPASSDPEAFDCECLQQVQEECGEASETEGCIREMMCKHPQVCESWKGTQCDTALIAGAMALHDQVKINTNASTMVKMTTKTPSMMSESQATSLVERSARLTNAHDLDESLTGKCAS